VPATPWIAFRPPEADREYLVLLSELPLRRFRDLGRFLLYTWRIRGQLKRAPGVLGYSLLARPARRQFWTLSVWDDEAALQQFVFEDPHGQVMTDLSGRMGRTHFVRWRMRGAELPPRWPDALARRRQASP
jgi:hypothetical protein